MRIRHLFYGGLAVVLAATALAPIALAQVEAGGVKGYAAEQPIDYGTIVQLSGEASDRVSPALQSEMHNMFGVAVDPSVLPLTISNSTVKNETFVAVSGTYSVLVSNQAGEIAAGDYITLSTINGVGMKAGTEESTVLGRAGGSFTGSDLTLGTAVLRDVNGQESQTVALGTVPVTIVIERNPNDKSTDVNVPDFLKRVGEIVAEKEVSPIRLYLSVGIAVVSLIAALAVLYAGVRNGVISIGRNPMTKKSIFRALIEVILTSIVILIIGLFAVYLLLRL